MYRLPLFLAVFIALLTGSGVLRTEAATIGLRQVALIQLPGLPGFDQSLLIQGDLLISHPGSRTMDIFSLPKRRVMGHVQGITSPRGMAADAAAKLVYIADAEKPGIDVVSTADWLVKKSIALPAVPQDVVFSEKENGLYISASSKPVLMYLPLAGGEATEIEVGGRVEGMALDPQSGRLFVSVNNMAEIEVLHAAGAQTRMEQHWKLNASQPTGLAFDPQVGRLFVAVRYAVLSLNAGTGQEISRVATAAGTDTLRYDAARQVLYAASTDGTVTTIAADKGTLTAQNELRTSVKGHSLALDPETHLLYLPGGSEGKSKLLVLKPYSNYAEADTETDADEAGAKPPATPKSPQTQ